MKIASIQAIQILDSHGNPTIETIATLEDGSAGVASVPSGASTGTHEAVELRDNDQTHFEGKGVQHAITNIHELIAPKLIRMPVDDLRAIDTAMIELDGTENKGKLGANAILSVSLACARALAISQKKSLWKTIHEYYFSDITPSFPRPMVNIINGGMHAAWAFDIQEFMIIPKSVVPSESIETAQEVFDSLGKILEEKGLSILKGDEGGYAPMLSSNTQAFELIKQAITDSSHLHDIDLGIDAAASEFFHEGVYELKKEGKKLSAVELSEYYRRLIADYRLLSIEDPFDQEDWEAFAQFTQSVDGSQLVVGDDLYTTNVERIQKGVEQSSTNAVLIKPNQIGTLSETVAAIKMTQQAGWKVIISHRSGDTPDAFISDLAYACGADFLKAGSMSRSERLAKYNRLIEIEKNEI